MKNIVKIIFFIIFLSASSFILIEMDDNLTIVPTDTKWRWIKKEILSKPKKEIGFAIVGSSHIWCGIRSDLISQAFPGTIAKNFGRNWRGHDVDYLTIKRLIEHHHVSNLMIEMTNYEDSDEFKYPHPYFKFILKPSEIFEEYSLVINTPQLRDFLTYSEKLKKHFNLITEYLAEFSTRAGRVLIQDIKENLFGKDQELKARLEGNDRSQGFYDQDSEITIEKHFIDHYKDMKLKHIIKGREKYPEGSRGDYYLKKISTLAKNNNVKIYFVYTAYYLGDLPSDDTYAHFDQFGDILIPNPNVINRFENWRDISHLYGPGAVTMTNLVIALIKIGHDNFPYRDLYPSQNQ